MYLLAGARHYKSQILLNPAGHLNFWYTLFVVKLLRNFLILLGVVALVFFVIYFYSRQNLVKLQWCDNCDGARVISTSCRGLKVGKKVLFKKCSSMPI